MSERDSNVNPNENIAEILGFDPETGEVIEDRSGLKEVISPRLEIPQEVQSAFTDYIAFTENLRRGIKGYRGAKTKILPERLLYILQNVEHEYTTRAYYSWIQSVEGQIDFRKLTEAYIWKLDGSGRLMSIEQLGEATNWMLESARINFGSQTTTCTFHLAKRLFKFDFKEEGLFLTFVFGNDRYSNIIFEDDECAGPEDAKTFTEILTKRGLFELSEGLSKYELTIEKDVMELKRVEKGIVGDELSIPRKINREEIIQKLFDPVTLEDPIGAPPELDDSWRFANLMEVVGVKWERF